MSHISKIELEVRDLGVLAQACARLGLELQRDRTTFKWYGQQGTCDHRIRVPGTDYQVGVRARDGRYELVCDFFDRSLAKALGPNGGLLKQAYAVEKTRLEARRKGYSVLEQPTETGLRLRIRVA